VPAEGAAPASSESAPIDLDETQPVVPNQPVSPAAKIEEPMDLDDQPQVGNMVPQEKPLDDDFGNRA
jgi:hypothetical protein